MVSRSLFYGALGSGERGAEHRVPPANNSPMNHSLSICLAVSLALVAVGSPAQGQSTTYTDDADFDSGVLANVNHDSPNNDQLQLSESSEPFSVLSIACGGLDTVVRINTVTGEILGEYRTVPVGSGLSGDPSRATTDLEGSCWVGNRLEDGSGKRSFGSVSKFGVVVGGTRVDGSGNPSATGQYIINWDLAASTCFDRDNDGRIRTSFGLGDVLSWADVTDGAGGNPAFVEDAEDECILLFQRTNPERIRHLSIDANNNLWAGGYPTFPTSFDQLDGLDGSFLQNKTANPPGCGGYAGIIDSAGVMWSTDELAQPQGQLFRCDLPNNLPATCVAVQGNVRGIAQAPDGFIWTAGGNQLCRVSPDGLSVQFFNPVGASQLHGISIDQSTGEMWVASSGSNEVFRLDSAGNLLNKISVAAQGSQPRGLDMDHLGKVWVANQGSDNVVRIDPATDTIDMTVALRPGAKPYNPSDMIGTIVYDTSSDQGNWSVVADGGQAGTQWTDVSWNGATPEDSSLTTMVRSAASVGGLAGQAFVLAPNGGGIAQFGRFLEVSVDFQRSTASSLSPILFDLSVVGENPPPPDGCVAINRRQASSLLIYPEFDNRRGAKTFLTVTNVDDDLQGTLAIEFVYIEEETCLETNRTEYLTANDTLVISTKEHNPNEGRGYVYVFAKNDATGEPIVANSLIGQAMVITQGDGVGGPDLTLDYSVNAVGFKGIGDGVMTDLDLDGLLDLDGQEYDQAPASILVPRFLGQGPPHLAWSSLVMIGLTGGAQFDTTLDFLVYNDNEQGFSAEYTFSCWDKVPLLAISGVFGLDFLTNSTNDDPLEVLGAPDLHAGWMRVDGAVASSMTTSIPDPAFLVVQVERLSFNAGADLPFELCTQPGGALLPNNQAGNQ
jgi:hypothetical protein